MAVNIRQFFPIQQARARRTQLARYLQLDGGRYLIAAAVIFALLSLISLGQTGRLATQGYELTNLQTQQRELLRTHGALQLQLSEAQSLLKIEQRGKALNMRPMTPDQVQYVTIAPPAPATASAHTP
ncbi:MAG: hypothetical protein JST60_00485 [Chloroflexi bacterium SZAS-1]|jgi:hypothetical protein|nr:hypothetical protein [Chloroflexi bacterium SZAS-1]